MTCQKCKGNRVVHNTVKCSDKCFVTFPSGKEYEGYVPGNLGIGGGDYVKFSHCLDCGQIQGEFPVSGEEPVKEEIW